MVNKIILIGNYQPDRQESMIRFANMMAAGIQAEGVDAEIWWPVVCFGIKAKNTTSGLGKWLGYLDKYVIFPLFLKFKLLNKKLNSPKVRYHICDHSNAPYLQHLPVNKTSITCHDVIAIKGGFGYNDNNYQASKLGRIQQKWILYYLSRSLMLACVSRCTLTQLMKMVPDKLIRKKNWRVIYNSFNAEFRPMGNEESQAHLIQIGIHAKTPFILHVGSEQPRKNRKLLLEMVSGLGNRWQGNICFAGHPMDKDLMNYSRILRLQDRIISIENPDHNKLVALYSKCEAFIFPSYSEGFGWPLIEAQACGAPVITSSLDPMQEVTGGVALYANPYKPEEFMDAFFLLKDDSFRTECIRLGYENARRFKLSRMINEYLDLHRSNLVESELTCSLK